MLDADVTSIGYKKPAWAIDILTVLSSPPAVGARSYPYAPTALPSAPPVEHRSQQLIATVTPWTINEALLALAERGGRPRRAHPRQRGRRPSLAHQLDPHHRRHVPHPAHRRPRCQGAVERARRRLPPRLRLRSSPALLPRRARCRLSRRGRRQG